jgi:hypothetical protein
MTSDQRPQPPRAATVLPALDGGPSRDVHGARAYVVDRVAQLASVGALDAGNGDVLDAWLERLREKWHAHHATERSQRVAAAESDLGGLEAAAVMAQQRADAAAEDLQHTRRLIDAYERQFLEPVESRPNDRSERRRRPRAAMDPLEGLVRSWQQTLLVRLLVLLAAAGDLATFYLTLSGFFRDGGAWVLWLLTAAFTAASVGLMHGVGRALKDMRSGRGGLGRPAIGLMVTAWLTLGSVAVFFRTQVDTPSTTSGSIFDADPAATAAASEHEALLAAVLLAGLFMASGVLAFYAGFSEHHPQMTDYRALRKRLPELREQAERTAGEAVAAQQALEHTRTAAERAARRFEDGLAAADAEIAELRELVRVEVAGHLGQPAATNGLTTNRSEPDGSPGQEPDGAAGHPPVVPSPRPGPGGSEAMDEGPLRAVPETDFVPVAPLWGTGSAGSNGHGALNGSH